MNKRSAMLIGITALILLGGRPALASHPLGTEDPGTVAPKSVGVEITGEYSSETEGTETAFGVSVTTGLLGNVDVKVSAPYLLENPDQGDSENGIGDLELSLKWHFFAGADDKLNLAVKGDVSIPTGNDEKGLGSGDYDLSGTLIAAFALKPVDIFLNVGYGRLNSADPDAGEKKDIFSASAAAQWAITGPIAIVGEVTYESSGAEGDDPPVAATAGVIYAISESLSLDVGARIGLTDSAPDWSVLAGVNLAFGGK